MILNASMSVAPLARLVHAPDSARRPLGAHAVDGTGVAFRTLALPNLSRRSHQPRRYVTHLSEGTGS